MCHSFRQWIVPGRVELQLQQPERTGAGVDGHEGGTHVGGEGRDGGRGGGGEGTDPPLLHILRAPLLVKQEGEYAAGGGGLAPIAQDAEGAVRELCRGADPKARDKASELFEAWRLLAPKI